VFFAVRSGLALIPWVALRYPIKKITALVTLVVLFLLSDERPVTPYTSVAYGWKGAFRGLSAAACSYEQAEKNRIGMGAIRSGRHQKCASAYGEQTRSANLVR